jgi:hypothetical protein
MSTQNNAEFPQTSLSTIFRDYSTVSGICSEIASRGFAIPERRTGTVKFIGINPSYISGSQPDFITYPIDEALKQYPKYYKKFQDIAEASGIKDNWTYWDVFQFRETDQDRLNDILRDPIGLEFAVKQLQVTIDLLELSRPDLIVVCNSGARQFFGIDREKKGEKESGVWMGYEFEFDNRFGVDVITGISMNSVKTGIKTTNLLGTPVLFTSTLTYMDSSTKNRLAWQIRQILQHQKLFFGQENYRQHRSDKIRARLNFLLDKLRDGSNLKKRMATDNRIEESARLRDSELDMLEEAVDLIFKTDKNWC